LKRTKACIKALEEKYSSMGIPIVKTINGEDLPGTWFNKVIGWMEKNCTLILQGKEKVERLY